MDPGGNRPLNSSARPDESKEQSQGCQTVSCLIGCLSAINAVI